MGTRQFWFSIVLVTVACVLGLFFFPQPSGSFVATHGPVTALRALQALYLLCLTVAVLASHVLLCLPADTRTFPLSLRTAPAAPFPPSRLCLRC